MNTQQEISKAILSAITEVDSEVTKDVFTCVTNNATRATSWDAMISKIADVRCIGGAAISHATEAETFMATFGATDNIARATEEITSEISKGIK